MEQDNSQNKEYTKSRFRCPCCGKLAGCTEDGKVGIYSLKIFHEHVEKCRNTPREGKTSERLQKQEEQ
jgi:hypothetical protein